MQTGLSARIQPLRLSTVALCLLTLTTMAIPGSFVWCNYERTYYTGSYLWNNLILGHTIIWFGLAAVSTLISLVGFLHRKDNAFFFLI